MKCCIVYLLFIQVMFITVIDWHLFKKYTMEARMYFEF